jgi:hypothetical protein
MEQTTFRLGFSNVHYFRRSSSPNAGGYGSTMAHACGCAHPIALAQWGPWFAERANHVWAWDFIECRTHDGRKIRMLCVVDEFMHECLAIRVKRKLNNADVIETLADIILSRRALPEFMRSDNAGIHRESVAQMDRRDWRENSFYRKRIALGLPRMRNRSGGSISRGRALWNRSTPGCATNCEWRDLLHAPGSPDRHRSMAAPLQRSASALVIERASASAGEHHLPGGAWDQAVAGEERGAKRGRAGGKPSRARTLAVDQLGVGQLGFTSKKSPLPSNSL